MILDRVQSYKIKFWILQYNNIGVFSLVMVSQPLFSLDPLSNSQYYASFFSVFILKFWFEVTNRMTPTVLLD